MKTCVDCDNYRVWDDDEYSCHAPENGRSVVTGQVFRVSAEDSRAFESATTCGKDGRFFVPKRSLWTKIKQKIKGKE